ncbi:MAG: hydroxyacylglutathione hydrolase, partial [Gammaproteobacteria bacterium]|nr:hydroxyacylglutathione hydrolase [Gammaproteobacteria bacterium]
CLLSQTDTPGLFSGDTLFNAGAGNCHGGGHPEELYETFARQLSELPGSTLIYPGHDYITNNLEFTLDREPDNASAATLLEELSASHDPDQALITSLAQEKEINAFFRLTNPTVIARLREAFPDLPDDPSAREVFIKLRELRNQW